VVDLLQRQQRRVISLQILKVKKESELFALMAFKCVCVVNKGAFLHTILLAY